MNYFETQAISSYHEEPSFKEAVQKVINKMEVSFILNQV